MGLGEGDQVADGPGHDVSVAVLVAGATLMRAEDFSNVSRYGGLFGDDGGSPGWLGGH